MKTCKAHQELRARKARKKIKARKKQRKADT